MTKLLIFGGCFKLYFYFFGHLKVKLGSLFLKLFCQYLLVCKYYSSQRSKDIQFIPVFQKETEEHFNRAQIHPITGRTVNRTQTVIISFSDNCSICEIFRISAHCLTCLQGFCSECDRLYHSYPDRANHRRTTVTSKSSSQRKNSNK